MSREIKFRAWDGEGMFLQGDANSDEFWFGVGAEGLQLVLVGQRFEMGSGVAEEYSVPTDTDAVFMQYTGLKDRNGVEIYESDIVRILYTDWPSQSCEKNGRYSLSIEEYMDSISNIGVIVFKDCGFCVQLNKYGQTGTIHCGTHGQIKVIGNIHETPELLEQPQ